MDFLDPDCLEDIQPLIKGCLAAYFTSEDYPVTEENLRDFLLIDSDIIPLPAWPPYPSLNSLVFAYQQYEIAPYAAGMPAFAISFGELAPYLTPEAKKILGVE